MPFFDLKRELSQRIVDYLKLEGLTQEQVLGDFGSPPKAEMGHLALPCFRISKMAGKKPFEVAQTLATADLLPGITGNVSGPYANFRIDTAMLCQQLVEGIQSKGAQYGSDQTGKGQRVLIEYCSPNIAKRLAFQHIRSTLLGNTLSNVYDRLGFETERINFVGDWGTQFARLLAAVETWGEKNELSESDVDGSMKQLFELYVRFHQEVDKDESLAQAASKALASLEKQEAHSTELWNRVRGISLAAMERTLNRLNVKFDHVEGESTYIPDMERTLEEVKTRAEAKPSEGAWIVEVDEVQTPALIQKRDGTTLYLTRDIAAAVDRENRFHPDQMYYVVAEQQALHFKLLFGVLKKMGYDWADKCGHLSFGTVLFGAEKMSTREGRVIFLDDLLDEAKARALKECTQKNPDLEDKDDVAEKVGIGAIIFGNLSGHRARDIRFDWDQVLALDGETGPYVQYSAVRCRSLLEKAKEKGFEVEALDWKTPYNYAPEEDALVVTLTQFRSVLHQVIRENDPFYLTRYLIDVAKSFNRFYYQLPVMQAADPLQRQMRLSLVNCTRQVLSNGLDLLGMAAPKEM